MAHYDIPLDLPHAGRLAGRIVELLEKHCEELGVEAPEVFDHAERLDAMLFKFVEDDENPGDGEAKAIVARAAEEGRLLVAALETAGIRSDRLGQYVRNLFECLALGEEGADISLRAGENPASLQRPV